MCPALIANTASRAIGSAANLRSSQHRPVTRKAVAGEPATPTPVRDG
jgi:hypothetical protein